MYDSIGLIMSNLEKEDMLSFDLHPSWWFGRKMDDSDYEWRFFAEFYGRAMMWYVGHALMGLALNHHLKKVSIMYIIHLMVYRHLSLFHNFCRRRVIKLCFYLYDCWC